MASQGFSKKHEDIKLTKEEAEFLEQQFFKYLQKEMEKNSSNWEEYYDILKEETKPTPDEKTSASSQEKSQNGTSKQKSQPSKFKVNPEKTKQQYKEDAHNNSKWQTNINQNTNNKPKKNNINKQAPKQGPKQKTKHTDNNKSTRPDPKQSSNDENLTKTEAPTDEKQPDRVTDEGLVLRILYTIKYIVLIFICFALIAIVYVLHYAFLFVKVVVKYTFLLIYYLISKVLGWLGEMNQKRQITKKLGHYLNNTLELIHLVFGFDLKKFFSRWKKTSSTTSKSCIFDDLPLPALPESSIDAIHFLSKENAENPYRVLCVDSKATSDEIKTNYRKLVRLVHPDKCNFDTAEEAFKKLDTAFKRISDVDKRKELDAEIERYRMWEEYNKQMGKEYEDMFEQLLNTIHCNQCEKRHKKTLIKERMFDKARYCETCKGYHAAKDGDVWAEMGLLGINWKCYVCINTEVFEITEWATCQGLKRSLPTNDHRVFCRMGTQGGRKKRSKDKDDLTGKNRKGRKGKRRK